MESKKRNKEKISTTNTGLRINFIISSSANASLGFNVSLMVTGFSDVSSMAVRTTDVPPNNAAPRNMYFPRINDPAGPKIEDKIKAHRYFAYIHVLNMSMDICSSGTTTGTEDLEIFLVE